MKGSRWLLLVAALGLGASACVVETECIDDNANGICDIDETCIDDDLNGICDVDEGCTADDNSCSDTWLLNYCGSDGIFYTDNDCQLSCTTDDRVYAQTCAGNPAVAGECGQALGACVCWCEDAFDSCVAGTEAVRYTRDGVTYEIDCKDYCNGTCDDTLGACACP